MIRPLHKKLLRTILFSPGQTLAVSAVVCCGVAAYITVYSAYLNLSLTRDTYYKEQRFADFEILLDRAPRTAVFKVQNIPGVRQARARIVRDANLDIPGVKEPRVGRIISMPATRDPVINDIVLTEGRYFDAAAQDEVIVSDRFARTNNLKIGDRFQAAVESKKYSLRVVGMALSPEYIYAIRNVQEIVPSPERFGVLWTPEAFAETALDMKAACNNIVGLVDNQNDLDAILNQAEKILDAYGVFGKVKQADQISNHFLTNEIHGLGVSARVVPPLFLGVASLILLVLLNRMVRTERTQIGLLKAYGYSDFGIAIHYLQFAMILAGVGCIMGFFVGEWMAGGLTRLYTRFYQFPMLLSRIYPEVLAKSIGLTIVFGVLGALSAARRAARIHPAESMRPEAPRMGHTIWLERMPAVWRRISFNWKMILRNIARNPFRAGLSAFGATVSTALLIMSWFMLDSIEYGMHFQFREVQHEDLKVSFQTEEGKRTLYDLMRFAHVRRAEPLLEYPFTMRSGWRHKDTVVIGMPRHAEMQVLTGLSGKTAHLDESGLVLSDRLAEQLNVVPGDMVTLKPLMGRIRTEHTVPVRAVTENFLGSPAYMDITALSGLLDESFALNAALLRVDPGTKQEVNDEFKNIANVASVGFREDVYKSLRSTLGETLRIDNMVILIFAAVIAFSIIYNVASISLAERERELASLRVLGLTQVEVGRILYDENALMGVIGTVCGIPPGLGLCWLLVWAYSNDLFRLPFVVTRETYGLSIGSTLLFVLMANIAIWLKIRKLDLVEVLKERE